MIHFGIVPEERAQERGERVADLVVHLRLGLNWS